MIKYNIIRGEPDNPITILDVDAPADLSDGYIVSRPHEALERALTNLVLQYELDTGAHVVTLLLNRYGRSDGQPRLWVDVVAKAEKASV